MKKIIFQLILVLSGFSAFAQSDLSNSKSFKEMNTRRGATGVKQKTETATFATGCFWCTEAKFQQLKGVKKVTSGFTGGTVANPTYEQVCTGTTGHAEVIKVTYDPAKISYNELLQAFFLSHDPTQLNRQGNDVGTQYRSVIFYGNEDQKEEAAFYTKKLQESGAYDKPVVTEIAPLTKFYVAEDYHQNYYNENGSQPYCMMVIRPKLEKFKKAFASHLKKQ